MTKCAASRTTCFVASSAPPIDVIIERNAEHCAWTAAEPSIAMLRAGIGGFGFPTRRGRS